MIFATGKKVFFIFLLLLVILSASIEEAACQTVRLPITIDYPLLHNLLVSQAFPEKNESVTLVNEGGGCIHLALSSPEVSQAKGAVKLKIRISAMAATPLAGECFSPLQWQGYLVLYEKPSITPDTWQLSFTTLDTELLDENRHPAQIAQVLWNFIDPHVRSYIAGIKIDLMPPVTDMKNFILPLFPEKKRREVQRMLSSMRPGDFSIDEAGLNLPILADVQGIYTPGERRGRKLLTDAELRETVAAWEKWDGLLVYLVTALSQTPLSEEEKRTLTNALLDTRYRFVTELSDRTLSHDIVREQFVNVWQDLEPIFRTHILRDSRASQVLGYLAFVTSADALLVFDRLGPTFGLEISTEGLVRLVKMLNADPALLHYRSEINPDLQKLFQLQPELPSEPSTPPVEIENSNSMLHRLLAPFVPASAFAGQSLPSFEEIIRWKVPQSDIGDYLKRVEKILTASSSTMIKKANVPDNAQAMYRNLIPAMAWQESCFRQFVVKGDKLTYLLSYNNSSVGLMQVNERVWRGLYDLNRLRWDIAYNASAGSEIAALYLNKYAFRDKKLVRQLEDDTLARLVYAMYNGGPSQYSKFMKRLKANTFYDSDKLFFEKYSLVRAGQIQKVSICLTGS